MIRQKLMFEPNESLPSTYNGSPVAQSPDAHDYFGQWDTDVEGRSPSLAGGGGDLQNTAPYDRYLSDDRS